MPQYHKASPQAPCSNHHCRTNEQYPDLLCDATGSIENEERKAAAMAQSSDGIDAYIQAVSTHTPEALAALGSLIADDIVISGPVSPGSGRDAVLAAHGAPDASQIFGSAEWGEPSITGNDTTVEATLPPGLPISGMRLTFALDTLGKITRVDQEMLAAPPPAVTELKLTADITVAVNGALANATPVVVTYVDAAGVPHQSFRGSTQVYGDEQLAIWVRDPEGGLLKAIQTNPAVAVWYLDPATRTNYQFSGRARVEADPAVREVVFINTPEPERNADPRRNGVAVVVDLDTVEGMGPSGRFRMGRKP